MSSRIDTHFDARRSRATKSTVWGALFLVAIFAASFCVWAIYTAVNKRPDQAMGLVYFGLSFGAGLAAYKVMRYKRDLENRDREILRLSEAVLGQNVTINRSESYEGGQHQVIDYDRVASTYEQMIHRRNSGGGSGLELQDEHGNTVMEWRGPINDHYFDANGVLREDILTDEDRRRYFVQR